MTNPKIADHITASNLQSIPKNLLPLLPKPDSNKTLTSQEHLLFTVQQLHQHAIRLYRSIYLHTLHIKEKDEQIVRFRGENDNLKVKIRTTTERVARERKLFMEHLGLTWIQMSKRLNRMDLLEYMEEEWNRINDLVKREMSNVSTTANKLKLTLDPQNTDELEGQWKNESGDQSHSSGVYQSSDAISYGQSRLDSPHDGLTPTGRNRSTRRFREPAGPSASPSNEGSGSNIVNNRFISNIQTPNDQLSQHNQIYDKVTVLREEGDIFQSDTQLVQFLKKYAAEGFLHVDGTDFINSIDFQQLKARTELEDMTMTEDMLTQWLWMFENNEALKERIRLQNRYAGIVADSELTHLNQKLNPPPPPVDVEELQRLRKQEQDELEKLRKEMEKYKRKYGALDDSDDEFSRRSGKYSNKRGRDGHNEGGNKKHGRGKRGMTGKSGMNGKFGENEHNDNDEVDQKDKVESKFRSEIDYDAVFGVDDPANPNHPDHLKYILDLQEKAKALERLRQEFERQRHLLRKRQQEINALQSNPKYTTDIDEKLLMDRIYDYRRTLQERDDEIQRLKLALREKEKRRLKRNGQLNVFEFISVDNLKHLKLSNITDSSKEMETMRERPNTANVYSSFKSTFNPSSFIVQPDDKHREGISVDVSSIQANEDRRANNQWMQSDDSTFLTSVRRPQTAAAGKIHPTTVPVIRTASGIYQESQSYSINVEISKNSKGMSQTAHFLSTTLNSTNPNSTNLNTTVYSTYPNSKRDDTSQTISMNRASSPLKNMPYGDTAHYEIKRPKTSHSRPVKERPRKQPFMQQSLQIMQSSKNRSKSALASRMTQAIYA